LHRYPINKLRCAHKLIHHLLELHERNVPVPVLIGLTDDLLPDVLVAKLLTARSQHLLDLFSRYLAVAVLVEVFEGLCESIFLEYLFFIDAGYLPLTEVNAAVAVQVRSRKGLIHFFLQVTLLKVAIDLAEAIKKFFFSYFSIAVTI
jgi:hypothetical protein